MSTTKLYDILRWDSLLSDQYTSAAIQEPQPIIFFSIPNDSMNDSIMEPVQVRIRVSNTQSIYDTSELVAKYVPASYLHPHAPSTIHQRMKGMYALIVEARWQGYPPLNGQVQIIGYNNSDTNSDIEMMPGSAFIPRQPSQSPNVASNKRTSSRTKIMVAVLALLAIIYVSVSASTRDR